MINANTDSANICCLIVYPIWVDLAQILVSKIIYPDRFWLAFWLPFSACIFKISNQFLFFGVNRNNGLVILLKYFYLDANIPKLSIAVWMAGTFTNLAVRLKTVTQIGQQLRYFLATDFVPHWLQGPRQLSCAFACPAQWRFGITSGGWLNHPFQVMMSQPSLFSR